MQNVVSATEARVHFGDLLHRVADRGETVFVERSGRLRAVVMAVPEYERLVAALECEGWRERARRARECIRAELSAAAADSGGPQPGEMPPAEDVIRTGREERDEHISGMR